MAYTPLMKTARDLMSGHSTTDESARSEIERLQARLEQQNLLLQTVITVLLDKGLVNEEQFRGYLEQVDGLDGSQDGKLAEDRKPLTCKECGGKNSPDKSTCMYCGKGLLKPSPIRRPKA